MEKHPKSDHKKNKWQKRESLVFRQVRESGAITLNTSCEVGDIKVNDDALKLLNEGKHVADNSRIITMDWDDFESKPCSSVCEIHLDSDHDAVVRTFILEMVKDQYHHLRNLTDTIFRDYAARITHIQLNPFKIGFLHKHLKDFKNLSRNMTQVEETLTHLFTQCTSCSVQVQPILQLTEYQSSELEELARAEEDTIFEHSGESGLAAERNHDEKQVESKDEDGAVEDEEKEKKFKTIESTLRCQRCTFERRFKEQGKQNKKMSESLEKLQKCVQQLHMSTKGEKDNERSVNTVVVSNVQGDSKGPPESAGDSAMDTSKREVVERKDTRADDGTPIPTTMLSSGDTNQPRNLLDETKNIQTVTTTDTRDVVQNLTPFLNDLREDEDVNVRMKDIVCNRLVFTKKSSDEDKSRSVGDTADFDSQGATGGMPTQTPDHYRPTTDKKKLTAMMHTDKGVANSESSKSSTSVVAQNILSDLGVVASSPETRRLLTTLEIAMKDEYPMPSRARALDTILCLDTSSSMMEEGLKEVKEIATNFVDGIEDIVTENEIEENIAVVTFGGQARIAHHLSNDYSSVRDAIENLKLGGRSPLFEAFMVCLCVINGRGGVMNFSGVHFVPPRLIIITDGKASDETDGPGDVECTHSNVRLRIVRFLRDISNKGNTFPKPMVWIPAGRADRVFMESLVQLSQGKLMKGSEVTQLCSYQRIQQTVGELCVCLQTLDPTQSGTFESKVESLIGVFAPKMDKEDEKEVIDTVTAKLDGKEVFGNSQFDPLGFDNIVEVEGSPKLGTRVIRGPDWKWGDQDRGGPGTVINHGGEQGLEQGLLWVRWDHGSLNQYRYGQNNAFDVWETNDHPRDISTDMPIEIGCEVTRGPDWKEEYGAQDGVGVVIRKNNEGKVKVRWRRTCHIGAYRYRPHGPRDVLIRDVLEYFQEQAKVGVETSLPTQPKAQEQTEEGIYVWRWKDETNRWHQYSEENNKKLEEEFAVRPHRSCLIEKNGESSYRVFFKDMQEKNVNDHSRKLVERRKITKN